MLKIFISHSSADSVIAEMLADLFQTAMCLSKKDIRCTSVDGYRLPAGANTNEQLRKEVLEAQALVGLISNQSLDSAYVLFELGARWGTNLFMVPLLAPGLSPSVLKGPLSGLNALSCDSSSQIHQMVSDVSSVLKGIKLEPAAAYQKQIDSLANYKILEKKKSTFSSINISSRKTTTSSINNESDELTIIKHHCESEWPNDFAMRVHCEKEQKQALERLQSISYDDIPKDVIQQIRREATKEWPNDFTMRLHTENEQVEAYRQLQS